MKQLLSGNQALARAAYEGGVTVASGYPGTPSTEILENLARYGEERLYCEWAPNEKVALEVVVGASLAGARCLATMKHVGLNVAADPLMTLAYIGTVGGLVLVVADDPGMHSSQNEQDSRNYVRFAKVPLLEPADSQEARDFLLMGLELSEQYRTPVILRSTTRVSHSRTPVEIAEPREPQWATGFVKDPSRYVTVPLWARPMRVQLEERVAALQAAAETSALNRIEWRDRARGILTSGICYQYVREAFPEASVLKLGWSFPYPDALVREFAAGVEELLVVEELDPFVEEHVRALGIACEGKRYFSPIGELSTEALVEARARLEGKPVAIPGPVPEAADLPPRPPVLCAGCPHRGVFHGLGKLDVAVTGDIGCYSLGAFPPLSRLDSILCMGAGLSMAHGMDKAREPRKVVGMVGDSTFFHSGITALLGVGYNRGAATLIVLDNRTTAMTGHQEHPGSGKTLQGKPTFTASVEEFGRACGIPNIRTVDPYNLAETAAVLKEAVDAEEAWLIVSKGACVLQEPPTQVIARRIDPEQCHKCKQCLRLGCPAIEGAELPPTINELLCTGCGMCDQVCRFGAIAPVEVAE